MEERNQQRKKAASRQRRDPGRVLKHGGVSWNGGAGLVDRWRLHAASRTPGGAQKRRRPAKSGAARESSSCAGLCTRALERQGVGTEKKTAGQHDTSARVFELRGSVHAASRTRRCHGGVFFGCWHGGVFFGCWHGGVFFGCWHGGVFFGCWHGGVFFGRWHGGVFF